jgi:ubiquinone/menaquinone biosynthesis C-methylase UbiE
MQMNVDSDYKEKSTRTFNQLAKRYDSSLYGRQASRIYSRILERLDRYPYGAVLDVGCGTGTVLSMIPRKAGVRLYGVDLAPEMIKVAQDRMGPAVELKVGDSEHLPWPDSSFDAVLCSYSFHHYPQPEKVLLEMRRVLRSDGQVVIADPWAPAPLRQIFNFSFRFGKEGDVKVYSHGEMVAMLGSSGFTSIDWQRIGMTDFIVSAASNK